VNPQTQAKAGLRSIVRARLADLSPGARQASSAAACGVLRAQGVWREAVSVLVYAPLSDELDLTPLVAEGLSGGKRIAFPGFEEQLGRYGAWFIVDPARDLVRAKFGIAEPALDRRQHPAERVDLILVPGRAFATDGRRLGRGRGFYDRLLAVVSGQHCGVAFDFQLLEAVPAEPHDVRMDYLLTPTRWLECRPSSRSGDSDQDRKQG
jgi:5-formyltetrahydrofolate cyclo-ligase